jgi:ribose transport system substrate-binding protein
MPNTSTSPTPDHGPGEIADQHYKEMKAVLSERAPRFGSIVLAAAAVILAAGCGTSQSSNTSAATGSGGAASATTAAYAAPPATIGVSTPVSKPIPSGKKIILVAPSFPESVLLGDGLKDAAAVLGWNVQVLTYDAGNPATIDTSLRTAISQKPAAIVLDGLVQAQFASAIPEAQAAKIPIISTESVVKTQPSRGVYQADDVGVENGYGAKQIADAIAADSAHSGKTAHVLQVTVPQVAVFLAAQDSEMKSELAAKCPNCTRDLLNITLPDVFNGAYTHQVVSYLQSHPNINYVVSDSGQLGSGLGAALSQAGLNSVKRYGIVASQAQIQELSSGSPGAWTVEPYRVIGWIAADEIARKLVGDPTNLWLSEHLSYVVTSGNAKNVNAADPEFPANYQAQFKRLWGK